MNDTASPRAFAIPKIWTFARYSGMRNRDEKLTVGQRWERQSSGPEVWPRGRRRPLLQLSGGLFRQAFRAGIARRKPRLAALVALALTGCATVHTRYSTVYCVTPDQYAKLKQAEPPKVGDKLTGNAQDDLKTIAGSAVRLRTFSDGLLGVIGSCVDPNTEAPAK